MFVEQGIEQFVSGNKKYAFLRKKTRFNKSFAKLPFLKKTTELSPGEVFLMLLVEKTFQTIVVPRDLLKITLSLKKMNASLQMENARQK
jgi:hypothetical protein